MKKLGFEITDEAEADYRSAVAFYADDSKEAARAFAQEFRAVIALLRERPLIGTPHLEGTRRKVLSRFPFSVIYDVLSDRVGVIAVAHHSRDPEYWLERAKHRRGG
ncbi:MAG TPA: type II toxin-antitoxin system RelE/ParE family toxin [Longimicrobium sp.]|nr:type II toxin-antitoxin system RelE/ParE family toxin [Longimicrobium sp.]